MRVMLAGFSDLFLEAAARGQIQDWAEAVSQTVKFIAGPSRLTKVYER